MLPSIPCLCVQQFIGDGMVLNVELAEYSDFVFLLSKLWEVDMDAVKLHWVTNLFAAGLVDQGKQVCIVTVDNLCVGGGGGEDIQLLNCQQDMLYRCKTCIALRWLKFKISTHVSYLFEQLCYTFMFQRCYTFMFENVKA